MHRLSLALECNTVVISPNNYGFFAKVIRAESCGRLSVTVRGPLNVVFYGKKENMADSDSGTHVTDISESLQDELEARKEGNLCSSIFKHLRP